MRRPSSEVATHCWNCASGFGVRVQGMLEDNIVMSDCHLRVLRTK